MFLSSVNDYIEYMATFTVLAKFYSIEHFCNTRVARLGEIFIQRKFSAIQYKRITPPLTPKNTLPGDTHAIHINVVISPHQSPVKYGCDYLH